MGWFSDFWSRILGPREIEGTDQADTLSDSRRDDTITALDGDDQIYISYGEDTVSGGKGQDTLFVEGSIEDYTLERLPPTSEGNLSDDPWFLRSEIYGDKELSSIEFIIDEAGNVLQTSPYETLQIEGTENDDIIYDNPFDDRILTYGGNDTIYITGTGVDIVHAGEGIDTVHLPGDLSDYHISGQGRLGLFNNDLGRESLNDVEIVVDASGNIYDMASVSEAYSINGHFQDDILNDREGMDFMTGFDGNDTFYTTTGDDTVIGGNGDDTLFLAGDLEDYEIILGQEGNLEVTLISDEYGTKLLYDTEYIGSIDGDAILEVAELFA